MQLSTPTKTTSVSASAPVTAAPVRREYRPPTLKLQGSISHLTQGVLRGPRVAIY
jgi:hypothetical protein